jgi:hypothetical protein
MPATSNNAIGSTTVIIPDHVSVHWERRPTPDKRGTAYARDTRTGAESIRYPGMAELIIAIHNRELGIANVL